MKKKKTEKSWAIVELMGHVRMAGILTEEERFGAKMGRVDIPQGKRFVTQYFGGQSVYRITPCTEETARSAAECGVPAPVHTWELPKPKSLPPGRSFPSRSSHTPEAVDSDEEPF